MYEEYYGFVQPPFSLTPDPRFLYRSESHDIALQQVWQAIQRKEGFIVLTGDIGTGKTTLSRTLLEQFDTTTFAALVLNPFLDVDDLLREILLSYGVVSKEAIRGGRLANATRHDLVRVLHDFLLSLVPLGGGAVLIIDEAQNLSTDVLEEIRVLSNLETSEQKLLQIVLVGQLNLLDVLHDAKLRQLDQRISIRCRLKPLNREELEAYITHRLWVARGSTTVTFTPGGMDHVHATSGGVPRIINLICDRALMAGSREKTATIGEELIAQAADAIGLSTPAPERRGRLPRPDEKSVRVAALAAIVAALLLGVYVVYAVGNPLALLQSLALPMAQPPPPLPQLPAAQAAPPPATLQRLTPPPLGSGGFSVLVGAFAHPRDATRAETALRAAKLPLYAVDLTTADGTVTRRLFVGRFASRAEAMQAHQRIAAAFPGARVTAAFEERLQ